MFRLDLPQACPALNSGNPHLVTHVRGSAWICSPVDIDLKVADDNGFQTPCIVGGMTPLSPGEVAALPPQTAPLDGRGENGAARYRPRPSQPSRRTRAAAWASRSAGSRR